MAVALISHRACLAHDTGPYHPECAERLRAVLAVLEGERFASLLREEAPRASREALTRVHPEAYVEGILAVAPVSGAFVHLDADTVMSAGSAEAALRAAGAAVAGVDAVMEGWARAAFAATRPPGHHAEASRAMGFCLFNNAAVAAAHARAQWSLDRVAVLDFDVHHGNGTESLFAADAAFFYASTHQAPAYPFTGAMEERGPFDNIRNQPLPPGCASADFRAAWAEALLPEVARFAPELIIISAGFDGHKSDPLAAMRLETADFGWITDEIVALADQICKGRVVSLLEGGYDPPALAASVAAHVGALMRG